MLEYHFYIINYVNKTNTNSMEKLITITLLLLSVATFSQERKNLEIDFEFTSITSFDKDFDYYWYDSYEGLWGTEKRSGLGIGLLMTFTAITNDEKYIGFIVSDVLYNTYADYHHAFDFYLFKENDFKQSINENKSVEIKSISHDRIYTRTNLDISVLDNLNSNRGLKNQLSKVNSGFSLKTVVISIKKYDKFLRFNTSNELPREWGEWYFRNRYFEVEGTSMYNILK